MALNFLIYFATYLGLFVASFYIINLVIDGKKPAPKFPEKNPPKVSIIIPAWNEEKGIARTIKSALNIDYPRDKFEIIVVDDGSTDKTYEIALTFKSKLVKIFKQSRNQGKGAAINKGLKKAKGEIIVTTDADNTRITPDALKKLVACFNDPQVMCTAPSIAIYKPKGILQRIQQVEYLLGVFLRKAFSSVNAIHITPGAFSAYRKSFFDKYGGFSENNLTEDMEMALRIQYHHYRLVNNPDAVVYAVAPNKFKTLLIQRRRWYAGLIKNIWDYRALFSKKYGILGILVLPLAIISVIISIILTSYVVINSLFKIKKEILLWKSINFHFMNSFELNKYIFSKYFFILMSNPITIFFIILVLLLLGYMFFAKTKIKQYTNIRISLILFLLFFSLLFVFWWIVSIIYIIFNKKISWR